MYYREKDGIFSNVEFHESTSIAVGDSNFMNLEGFNEVDKFNLNETLKFIKNSEMYSKKYQEKEFPKKIKLPFKTSKTNDKYISPKIVSDIRKEVDELKKQENNFINEIISTHNLSQANLTNQKSKNTNLTEEHQPIINIIHDQSKEIIAPKETSLPLHDNIKIEKGINEYILFFFSLSVYSIIFWII